MSQENLPKGSTIIELRLSQRLLMGIGIAFFISILALVGVWVALAQTQPFNSTNSPALVASTVTSYQGRVAVNNIPFNGIGQFKFAVIDAQGTAAYWSNDGTGLTVAPFQPTNAVSLTVSDGLFSVLLGDTSLPNMTEPLKPEAFAEPDRVLRVWFNDGVNGFQQLTPDVKVASAPYALNAEFARTSPNLQRIALLRWYTAISTTGNNFAVGLTPVALAFDGSNMWVSNYNSHSVTVLRVNDGSVVRTVPVGQNPQGLAYDGANMWVTSYNNSSGNTVSVIRASDGVVLMTPTVGIGPIGIAFDGARMWVTNRNNNTISVLNIGDAVPVMTIPVSPLPQSIVFDGEKMWVSHGGSNLLSVIRVADGSQVMTPSVGLVPAGLAFDGTNLWVANFDNGLGNTVSVLRANDGFQIMTPTVGLGPLNLAFDGSNIWVTNFGDGSGNTASVLRASDGGLIATVPVETGPQSIAFDGANIWITNVYSHTVSKR